MTHKVKIEYLDDVSITSIADGDILMWNDSTQRFENVPEGTTSGGGTWTAHYAEVKIVSAQTVNSNTQTKIAYDTVVAQSSDTPFNTTTNTFTCPVAGLYGITAGIQWNNGPSTNQLLTLQKGGSDAHRGTQYQTQMWELLDTWLMRCALNDALTITAYQNSGNPQSILVNDVTTSFANFEYLGP